MKTLVGHGRILPAAIIFCLFAPGVRSVRAQVDPADRSPHLRAPSAGTWFVLAGLGAASMLSTTFQDADETAGILERSPLEGVIDTGDGFGDGLTLGIGTASLLALGHVTGNERMTSMGGDMVESLLLSSAVVWAIKPTVNATRPDGGRYSFPSGHTAAAFSVAPVIARHLGCKAGLAAYTVASLTGLARMEDRRHYLSDVLFGAAIGIAAGREVVRANGLRAVFSSLSVSGRRVGVAWSF